jgi:hypothetical protein
LDETIGPGGVAPAVWIADAHLRPEPEALDTGLARLGLTGPRPVLVLVGGAANLPERIAPRLLSLFEGLAPHLDALGATLIDGGTAFGVMALMGQARARAGARFPLLGIAPRAMVALAAAATDPADGAEKAPLDPNHTHFMLVPGDQWGEESPWISAVADRLAGGRGSLMLVAGGGEITRLDVLHRLRAGGPVLTLAGSGGAADCLADDLAELLAEGQREGEVVVGREAGERARDLIEVLDLADAHRMLPARLGRSFSR